MLGAVDGVAATSSLVVGVVPPSALTERPRLFGALSGAFHVSFEARAHGDWRGLAGAIVAETGDGGSEPGVPSLSIEASRTATVARAVTFSESGPVDPRLRGRRVDEADPLLRAVPNGDERGVVLARSDGGPLWVRGDGATPRHLVCALPRELDEDESLRDRVKTGHFVDAVPLIHFLRDVSERRVTVSPPLRAAFVLDDPNLHWHTYGYVDFAALARHAREHGYHVAIATVPLDAWFVSRRAAEIFRREHDVLSLSIHGNNHVRQELGRDMSIDDRYGTAAKALERIQSLERRTAIHVSRVMVAPHETCTPSMMRALAATEFEALCFAWRVRRKPQHPLAGFRMADVVDGGLPLIPRQPASSLDDEFVFRAFLDQPLVFGGHHQDVADQMRLLESVATAVNDLGAVQWLPLDEIARRSYRTWSSGATAEIELFARRVRLDVPDGVDRLKVSLAALDEENPSERVVVRTRGGQQEVRLGEEFGVTEGETVDVVLRRVDAEAKDVVGPRTAMWPIVRRAAVEARDRTTPGLARLRRRLRASS